MNLLDHRIQQGDRFGQNRACVRRGTSLGEVMVVMTVSTILLGVAVSLLTGLRKWDRELRESNVQRDHLLRLTETLRKDVRGGIEVSAPAEGVLLIRSPDGIRIQYNIQSDGCRRTITRQDEAAPQADFFAVGPATNWKLENDVSNGRLLAMISLVRPVTEGKKRLVPLIVYAALGQDLPAAAP